MKNISKNPLQGKENIKIIFVRPPEHLWPIINESDNFLLPLSFPCLASYLRSNLTGVDIKIIDCLPLKIGWQSLGRLLAAEKPDVVGFGEMVCYAHEGIRLAGLVKSLFPDTVTVAGGHFHSHLPEYSLKHHPEIDYVVMYEGEEAMKQLIVKLRDGGSLDDVKSIAYRDESGGIRINAPGKLLDINELPMPAYDLMPVEKYSPYGMLWPRAITIQGNRGCLYNCNFCSWSALEGEHFSNSENQIELIPRIRQKRADKTLAELEILLTKYKVNYLFWVEGTWNYDEKWLHDVCSEILKQKWNLKWWAFVRSDLLLAQEKSGLLEIMVKAGLNHVLIGGERGDDKGMAEIGKTDCSGDSLLKVCHLFAKKYPQVFRQATFLTGIRSETIESMDRLGEFSRKSLLDFAAFHPIMPYPGTPLWVTANENNWIQEKDFSKYDMFHPVIKPEKMSCEEVSHHTQRLYIEFVSKNPLRYISGMFSVFPFRRRLHWWFLYSIFRVLLRDLWLSLIKKKKFEGFASTNKLWKPAWYDS